MAGKKDALRAALKPGVDALTAALASGDQEAIAAAIRQANDALTTHYTPAPDPEKGHVRERNVGPAEVAAAEVRLADAKASGDPVAKQAAMDEVVRLRSWHREGETHAGRRAGAVLAPGQAGPSAIVVEEG